MENNEIKVLYSRVFKNLSLWASQSYKRSLFVLLIFLIFGVPFIGYLQTLVRNFPYISTISSVINFLNSTYKLSDYITLITFLLIGFAFYLLYRQSVSNKVIKDNFSRRLNSWAIPLDASWTTEECLDVLGKMLCVTNSPNPGTLKGAYSWYDYEVSFWTKMDGNSKTDNPNFCVVIRSENNFNGIMLQVTKSRIRPHFLYNGMFIIDNESAQRLPTTLKLDEWIKVKLIVKGNNVDLFINGYELQYKIPTKVFNVANDVMAKGTVTLKEIESSHDEIADKHNQVLDILAMPASPAREEAVKTIGSIMKSVPPFTRIILEYQKGSIGFRESGQEQTYYRDFKAKKI